MKRINTYYLLTAAVINFIILASAAWFNPLIKNAYSPLGSSAPVLSLWALRMETVFPLIGVVSLFFMALSFMNRLSDKILSLVVFVILLSDVASLMVMTFGYSLPFVSYVPEIK